MAENVPISDIHNTPAELELMKGPSRDATNIAHQLYIKRPNLSGGTQEDRGSMNVAVQFAYLGHVARQMQPGPNTAHKNAQGPVKMSIIMRQFEESLSKAQDFVLGAP